MHHQWFSTLLRESCSDRTYLRRSRSRKHDFAFTLRRVFRIVLNRGHRRLSKSVNVAVVRVRAVCRAIDYGHARPAQNVLWLGCQLVLPCKLAPARVVACRRSRGFFAAKVQVPQTGIGAQLFQRSLVRQAVRPAKQRRHYANPFLWFTCGSEARPKVPTSFLSPLCRGGLMMKP